MKIDYPKTLNYLFVVFAFVLPITSAGVSVIAVLILLFWLAERDFSRKFTEIKSNPVALAVLGFIALHIVGLAWVDVEPINSFKSYLLLLIPIVMTSIKKEFIPKIFASFVAAMTVSEIFSYYKILMHWDEIGKIDPTVFAPFISHITYNPFLALTISMILISIVSSVYTKKAKLFLSIFAITMTLNLFFTGGRAGQVVLFVLFMVLAVYYFRTHITKLLIVLSLIPLLYIGLYYTNKAFEQRVNLAISDISNFQTNPNTSIGLRLSWTLTSLEAIKDKLIFGHGTGSFQNAYAKKNAEISPEILLTGNPHNNYILVLVQFGIVGLLVFLSIFYTQIKSFMNTPKTFEYKPLKLILPIMFMVICLSDTYLWGHHTQALFALFSGILYSDRVS